MKSETLTIDNIMVNGESKDLSKIRTCNSNSSYTNGERLKVIHFYSFLFSFLRRTKSGKSYPTRLSTSIKSLETTCIACTATLHFFKRANIICRIFALLIQHWLWIVAVNAFGMTLDISLWLKIVKMPYCVWPEEHKPTANSPNLETFIEIDLEGNGNDETFFCFFCGRDFKTKQGCSIHQRNCDEAH